MLREILGSIITLFSPLSACSLAKLLNLSQEDIDQVLGDQHAILNIPKHQTRPIYLHHTTFRDFLLDNKRCRDPHFWVNETSTHRDLTQHCIRLMSDKLKRDICGLQAPATIAKEVQVDRIEQRLPAELQYACRYWVQHLRKSQGLLRDYGPVHIFLRVHLLHWLEAMSLVGKTSESILAINSLESIVAVSQFS